MSIVKTIDVFCNRCGSHIGDTVDVPAKTVRRIARDNGWKYLRHKPTGRMHDLCENCWDKHAVRKDYL